MDDFDPSLTDKQALSEPSDREEPSAPVDACTVCGTTDPADENGLCPTPTCRCFRKSNKLAQTAGGYRARPSPEDEQRREQILADVQRDPNATTLREFQKDYAAKCVVRDLLAKYLTTVGPMTEAGRRRAALDAFLSVSESTQRTGLAIRNAQADAPSEARTPTTLPGIESMPTSALELSHTLLSRQAKGDALTEREQGALDVLRSAMCGEVALPPDPSPLPAPEAANLEESSRGRPEPDDLRPDGIGTRAESRPVLEATAAEPTCAYGCGSLARCAEIRATRLDAWQALHYTDPEEVKRRDEYATAVMMKQIRFGNPY